MWGVRQEAKLDRAIFVIMIANDNNMMMSPNCIVQSNKELRLHPAPPPIITILPPIPPYMLANTPRRTIIGIETSKSLLRRFKRLCRQNIQSSRQVEQSNRRTARTTRNTMHHHLQTTGPHLINEIQNLANHHL